MVKITFQGCYTALMTPFKGDTVDYEGLRQLVEYQKEAHVSGILAVGTTGESPTLNWNEHTAVIEKVCAYANSSCTTIAGTGSNSTHETMNATKHIADIGVDAALLVDPYYNGPSSMEIRREYIGPVAERFPDVEIIPYVIPGRTGTQLMPQDLAILHERYDNVSTVKEATGNLDNMRLTRTLCGDDFTILSGDDNMTHTMVADEGIRASGVISVGSNILPHAIQTMAQALAAGKFDEAAAIREALAPLFTIVGVATKEETAHGTVTCKARNPLPMKTLMAVLGMPVGGCRQPLGKMTRNGINVVISAAQQAYKNNPELFAPLESFFDINVEERLTNEIYRKGLYYDTY